MGLQEHHALTSLSQGRKATGLRWVRIYRHSGVLASPGLCGRWLNRCKGLSRCCLHTKPDHNIDEANITHAFGVEKGPGNPGVKPELPTFF